MRRRKQEVAAIPRRQWKRRDDKNAYVDLTFTRYSNAKPGGSKQVNAKEVGPTCGL